MDIDKILEASRAFYFESGDFNGYPVYRLKKEFALTESSEVKQTLVALIESERATSDPEPLNAVFAVFKRVRKLRQKPAHVVNDDTFDQQNFKEQRELMMQAYNAIRSIRLIFANHPAVRAQPPDIYPELRDGKIWTR